MPCTSRGRAIERGLLNIYASILRGSRADCTDPVLSCERRLALKFCMAKTKRLLPFNMPAVILGAGVENEISVEDVMCVMGGSKDVLERCSVAQASWTARVQACPVRERAKRSMSHSLRVSRLKWLRRRQQARKRRRRRRQGRSGHTRNTEACEGATPINQNQGNMHEG